MKVAFVTPESDPLVHRTQLAEFARSLPQALQSCGADVRVFIPRTKAMNLETTANLQHVGEVTVRDDEHRTTFTIESGSLGDVQVVLFSHPQYLAERHPYGDDEGPYTDNWKRYVAFSRAVLESFVLLDFTPDVIHCVDWTTGLLPILRELEYVEPKPDHPAAQGGTFFQIYNLAMQGSF